MFLKTEKNQKVRLNGKVNGKQNIISKQSKLKTQKLRVKYKKNHKNKIS